MATQASRYFYNGKTLSTLQSDHATHSRFNADAKPLGEISLQNSAASLLAIDQQASPLAIHTQKTMYVTYSPFGVDNFPASTLPACRFTGQYWQPSIAGYLLGNGKRLFNPALQRFHSPDTISPFAEGGINAYAYCSGDPINNIDPSGQFFIRIYKKAFGIHRDQLYEKLDFMTKNRNTAAPITKENSFSKREYKALKKLGKKDLLDSDKRLKYADKGKLKIDKHLEKKHAKYSEKEIYESNVDINFIFEKLSTLSNHDKETNTLIGELTIGLYGSKNRYYLPPNRENERLRKS